MKKNCTKCKIEKEAKEFYKDKITPSGLSSFCKDCYYQSYRSPGKAYGEAYRKEYSKKYKKKPGKGYYSKYNKLYAKNPEKHKKYLMRQKLNYHVRIGNIKKPDYCEKLDISDACFGRLEAHHDDYDKPLEVRWLCKKHHANLHSELLKPR